MIKLKFGLISLVMTFVSFAATSPVYAHLLKTDGNISARLHTEPDDDPIVGAQTGIFFEFKDQDYKFSFQNCNCLITIFENGREIFSNPLYDDAKSPTTANIVFVFPKKDTYQIKVVGMPKHQNDFQAFTLNYETSVDQEETGQTGQNLNQSDWLSLHLNYFIPIGILILLPIFVLIKNRLNL